MTSTSFGGTLKAPPLPLAVATSPNFGNILLDASGEKSAFVFQAPKTGNIDKLGFRTTTVTTGTTTVDIRLETFDTSTGEPTGTLFGTNTNVNQAIASSDDNVWFEVTLTASASVTKGDILCIVVAPSGTFSLNIASYADDGARGFPQAMQYTTSWASLSTGAPVCSVRYNDGSYPPITGIFPFSNINSHTYNSGSTPDVYANKINFPFNCKVSGAWVWADIDGDATIKLYDSDGVTVLASSNIYTNVPKLTGQSVNNVLLSSEVTLTANTDYWIGLEPSSGTSLVLYSYEGSTSSIFGQFPLSSNFTYSTAKDPSGTGSWTDDATRQVTLGVEISEIDDGSGSGGGSSESFYSSM